MISQTWIIGKAIRALFADRVTNAKKQPLAPTIQDIIQQHKALELLYTIPPEVTLYRYHSNSYLLLITT